MEKHMQNKNFIQFAVVTSFTGFTQFFKLGKTGNSINFINAINSKNASCCLLILICSLLFAAQLEAKVTGVCSICHTMHNSQGGTAVAKDDGGSLTDTPHGSLLVYSCVGCHSKTDAVTWKDSTTNAPIVFNTIEPTYGANGLAAGNFYYVSGTTSNTGHNIFSSNTDDTLGNTPPGGTALIDQLRCGGTLGCHGHNGRQSGDTAVHDQIAAMRGSHHGDDTPPLAGSLTYVAKNYRFLLGIKGKEDSDWEQDNVNTSHNEYQGATNFGTSTTISFLCGECHGDYHNSTGVGSTSPWLRHPTDIALKSTGEYASYTTYSMLTPVARPDPDDSLLDSTQVRPGIDIIFCLSCHRAHASEHFKLMRWNYKDWPGSGTNGCNVCHTSKN
jgi:hypothetical protein